MKKKLLAGTLIFCLLAGECLAPVYAEEAASTGEAGEASEPSGDVSQAAEPSGENAPGKPIEEAAPGDLVNFGRYEQDKNEENGPEPISWRVLSTADGNAFLISESVLDAKPYHEEGETDWENSGIRAWLNGEFAETAFTKGELELIADTSLVNEPNPTYGTAGGNDTEDKIFLLSLAEAQKYFADDEARMAYATDYAAEKNAWVSDFTGASWWWLRSPGKDGTRAAAISYGGSIYPDGINAFSARGAVRPALTISLENLKHAGDAAEETTSEAGTEAPTTEEAIEIPYVEVPDVINGQMIDYFYVNGDTAYEMYFFNLAAANKYGEILNHTAEAMKGQAKVYSIIAPLIETYHLTDEIRHSCEPEWANEEAAMNYYDSLMSADVNSVPVYRALLEHRDEYIFFRTDHHWTALGAYYAYRAFCKMKGIEPFELDHFEKMEFPGFLGSLYRTTRAPSLEQHPDTVTAYVPATTNMMTCVTADGAGRNCSVVGDVTNASAGSKYMAFCGGDNAFSYIENPNVDNGQVCIILKDSYANCFIPFLVDHYQYIYWFDYRDYGSNILNFAREHNATDIIFINGISPLSDTKLMERLAALTQ